MPDECSGSLATDGIVQGRTDRGKQCERRRGGKEGKEKGEGLREGAPRRREPAKKGGGRPDERQPDGNSQTEAKRIAGRSRRPPKPTGHAARGEDRRRGGGASRRGMWRAVKGANGGAREVCAGAQQSRRRCSRNSATTTEAGCRSSSQCRTSSTIRSSSSSRYSIMHGAPRGGMKRASPESTMFDDGSVDHDTSNSRPDRSGTRACSRARPRSRLRMNDTRALRGHRDRRVGTRADCTIGSQRGISIASAKMA